MLMKTNSDFVRPCRSGEVEKRVEWQRIVFVFSRVEVEMGRTALRVTCLTFDRINRIRVGVVTSTINFNPTLHDLHVLHGKKTKHT